MKFVDNYAGYGKDLAEYLSQQFGIEQIFLMPSNRLTKISFPNAKIFDAEYIKNNYSSKRWILIHDKNIGHTIARFIFENEGMSVSVEDLIFLREQYRVGKTPQILYEISNCFSRITLCGTSKNADEAHLYLSNEKSKMIKRICQGELKEYRFEGMRSK